MYFLLFLTLPALPNFPIIDTRNPFNFVKILKPQANLPNNIPNKITIFLCFFKSRLSKNFCNHFIKRFKFFSHKETKSSSIISLLCIILCLRQFIVLEEKTIYGSNELGITSREFICLKLVAFLNKL